MTMDRAIYCQILKRVIDHSCFPIESGEI